MRGLRGGATLLASVGADAVRVRLALFVIAALLAGLAGWLYAHKNRFVSPSPFDVRASIEYLLMAVAGGLGQLTGAIAGAAVLLLKNALQDVLPLLSSRAAQIEAVVFAALFIWPAALARAGLTGYVVRRWRRGTRRRRSTLRPSLAPAPLPRRRPPAPGARLLKSMARPSASAGWSPSTT
jgi:branched-chain amino acid transport system permease protein